MTFVKDPLNATTPREIIEYSQDLENRVGNAVDSIADYVIEQGVSGRAEFVKFASGRITIRAITSLGQPFNTVALPFPILTTEAGGTKLRFAHASVYDYDATENKLVQTCYLSGTNVIIQTKGITGGSAGATDVFYEVNAWWK